MTIETERGRENDNFEREAGFGRGLGENIVISMLSKRLTGRKM